MPSQVITSVENNFTKGLVTEFTGLNFPENAAIDSDNTEYSIVGDVTRRLGCNYESSYTLNAATRTSKAVNTYKWNNVGGDGSTQLVVTQVGATLYFYSVTSSNTTAPLSTQRLASTVTVSSFLATGATFDATLECQFTDGNGYLFVFHPNCDPFYCNYNAGTITGTVIAIRTRDLIGFTDDIAVTTRPVAASISAWHYYNVLNQGWTTVGSWSALSTSTNVTGIGAKAFTVPAGLTINPGDLCTSSYSGSVGYTTWSGTVTGYAGTTLNVNVTSFTGVVQFAAWGITSVNTGTLTTWVGSQGNYPSAADQWWRFKTTAGVFDPTIQANVTLSSAAAPKGHFLLYEFNQDRNAVSGSGAGLSKVLTSARPTNGCWFQGRIWYTGVNDSQQSSSSILPLYSWSEKIYFSQVCLSGSVNFGDCFQVNDPTSDVLFDILPTDGGVIHIQGSGPIYKLFPIQNGMLVFAANGIWSLTGSQGIGFSANDYTLLKISNVRAISGSSFVNVQGLPYFWNEEGVYSVTPSKNGGLEVVPITVGTILAFYREIPLESKKYARGSYHPIDYTIQWIYKSTNSTSTTDKYTFDKLLTYNDYNKAFYPYTVDITQSSINGIDYISGPGGSTTVSPTFKYFSSNTAGTFVTFSELHDTDYVDWASSGTSADYESYFITGYKLHGQAQRRIQVPYIYVFSNNEEYNSYKIQGLWDYALSGDTGRWSTAQIVENYSPKYGVAFRRHRIRGQGLVLQIKFTSVSGKPFDIIGWSTFETQNASV